MCAKWENFYTFSYGLLSGLYLGKVTLGPMFYLPRASHTLVLMTIGYKHIRRIRAEDGMRKKIFKLLGCDRIKFYCLAYKLILLPIMSMYFQWPQKYHHLPWWKLGDMSHFLPNEAFMEITQDLWQHQTKCAQAMHWNLWVGKLDCAWEENLSNKPVWKGYR